MLITAKTESGKNITLPPPVSLTLNRETAAPADELKAVFAVSAQLPHLCRLTARLDGEIIFHGIVDEQHTELTTGGLRVKLICRSLEALLLDNEAAPETLLHPTQARLERTLLTPLGLRFAKEELTTANEPLAITKGSSCYQVLNGVTQAQLGTAPRVDFEGLVHCTPSEPTGWQLRDVTSAKLSYLPCKLLSEVCQQSTRRSYDTHWKAETVSVIRRRYLSLQQGKNPKEMLSESLADSRRLTVTCKGAWLAGKSDTATVSIYGLGEFVNCPITAIRHTRSASGEQTRLQLGINQKEEAKCG